MSLRIPRISSFARAFNVREFGVFALVVFIGFLIGNFVLGLFPAINPKEPLGALIAFVVPVLIVYTLWAKWGRKAAD